MSRLYKVKTKIEAGVPRASGDEPGIIDGVVQWFKCSPRERG